MHTRDIHIATQERNSERERESELARELDLGVQAYLLAHDLLELSLADGAARVAERPAQMAALAAPLRSLGAGQSGLQAAVVGPPLDAAGRAPRDVGATDCFICARLAAALGLQPSDGGRRASPVCSP